MPGEGAATGERTRRAREVRRRLEEAMPEPRVELDFADAWQLLIATILSAQSTDRNVNRVTPVLFAKYPTPKALAQAPQDEVETAVKSTGFYRNKAKAIRGASQALVDRHGGRVPRTMEEMLELPGVARKTANVVLGSAYGIATGIVVDTHAARVAQRVGLTDDKDPKKVERDLCAVFPEECWIDMGHRLVLHGRYVCTSRNPACPSCPVAAVCPSRGLGHRVLEGQEPQKPSARTKSTRSR
jgi:endonuclease III